MNGLDAAQQALLRTLLEQRRAALDGERAAELVAGMRALAVDEVESSPADKATVRLLNDLAHESAGLSVARALTLRRALAKCDDGSSGLCEECDNPIGFSRLQARPEARLCIVCQTRAEKR
jgi:DnaK suppressor protein